MCEIGCQGHPQVTRVTTPEGIPLVRCQRDPLNFHGWLSETPPESEVESRKVIDAFEEEDFQGPLRTAFGILRSSQFHPGDDWLSHPGTAWARGASPPPGSTLMMETLYIQMEFCDGTTLREAIISGELQKDEALIWKLFRQVLDALAYVHSKDLIHRDVKPPGAHTVMLLGLLSAHSRSCIGSKVIWEYQGRCYFAAAFVCFLVMSREAVRSTARLIDADSRFITRKVPVLLRLNDERVQALLFVSRAVWGSRQIACALLEGVESMPQPSNQVSDEAQPSSQLPGPQIAKAVEKACEEESDRGTVITAKTGVSSIGGAIPLFRAEGGHAKLGDFGLSTELANLAHAETSAQEWTQKHVQGLVTLGTPHKPPPEGQMDMTFGCLRNLNKAHPGAYFSDDMFYVSIAGDAVVGQKIEGNIPIVELIQSPSPESTAWNSYQALGGVGNLTGDGLEKSLTSQARVVQIASKEGQCEARTSGQPV
eukprot:g15687.t1